MARRMSGPYVVASAGPNVADVVLGAERLFVVVALFLFSEALLGPMLAPGGDAEASAFLRLMWGPIYAATLLGLVARRRAMAELVASAWPLLVPIAIAMLSPLWSIDPAVSLRRGVALAMTTAFGLYLAAAFDWRGLVRTLGFLFAILAVMSVLVALLVPAIGIETEIHVGAWKGVFFHKNTFGAYMARGFVVFVAAALLDPRRARVWCACAVLAAGLVLMSTSKTSLTALLSAGAIMVFIAMVRTGPITALVTLYAGLVLGGAGLFVMVFAPDLLVAVIGRDLSLTGRTEIWEALGRALTVKPWLGYGYDVFWRDPNGPAYWVRAATQWPVPTAHNGWLETALSLGGIGLASTVGATLAAAWASVRGVARGRVVFLALPLLLLFIVFSLSESTVLARNSLVHVLFIAVASKLMADQRAGARAEAP